MRAVFLDLNTFSPTITLDSIKQQVQQLTCYTTTSADEVITRCLDADIIITNKVMLTAEILQALPKLKLICISATGYNNVDINAASKHNIVVTNVSGYASQSVAQYVFAQLLEYYQHTSHHNNNTEQGLWSSSEAFCYHGNCIHELAGQTLGIIGYGHLGKAVATIAKAFNMNIIISERSNSPTIRAGRTAFADVISQADIISLHCPQTAETEHLINNHTLSKMKDTAVLINTARGALIDESALLKALKNRQIGFAILDVLSQEPPPADHPFFSSDLTNIKVTAHIAWASIEAQQRLIDLLSENISAFKKAQPLNRLN
ncbi:D-2-hydroxyacid dehydrogenase [Colwelliaceae bacterium MEBiC 14330]